MQLERIEISGFRGIKRMSLAFDELTTLIGENTGVSLLYLMLCPPFSPQTVSHITSKMTDFHVDYSVSHPQSQHLQIVLALMPTTRANQRRSLPQTQTYLGSRSVWHLPYLLQNQRNVRTI